MSNIEILRGGRELRIILKSLHLENFKSIKEKQLIFSDCTTLKGANGVGKTTVIDAVNWVLFDKLADGTSADKIRPHDESGRDVDFVDIAAVLGIMFDDKYVEIKKVQSQKWTKPRGKQEQRFDGNVNSYEVNGIPKTEKDYKAYIAQFVSEEIFMFCVNAQAFLKMDNKKRRAKLFELVSDFENADIIAANTKFLTLKDMLMDGTIDELIARSKKIIKANKDNLDNIPARIDEVEKTKVDIDVAELELQKKSLIEQIKSIDEKELNISSVFDEKNKLSVEVMNLKFSQGEINRKANEENQKNRASMRNAINTKETEFNDVKSSITRAECMIETSKIGIEKAESEIEAYRTKWTEAKSRVLDENSLVCSYCGQEYPTDKKENITAEFESHKEEELKQITEKGNQLKDKIEILNFSIKNGTESIKELESNMDKLTKEINELEEQYKALPECIDASTTNEFIAISKQIESKEEELKKFEDYGSIKEELKSEKSKLDAELCEVNAKLSKTQRNIDADSRIDELTAQSEDLQQKILAEEKQLDLLEEFNRTKVSMLTEKINEHFSAVKWQLFAQQINGGYAEVCNPMVGGTIYGNGLNHGHRILADVDICKAFQHVNGLTAPIFVDDAESLDAYNTEMVMKDSGTQVVFMKVGTEKEMVVE